MRKIGRGLTTFILSMFIVCFAVVTTTTAKEVENFSDPVAAVTVGPHGITFQPKVGYAELVLTVSTPNGTVIKKVFKSGVTPSFELTGNEGDGSFTYELRVVPRLDKKTRTGDEAAGLQIAGTASGEPMVQSGYFTAHQGRFVTPSGNPEIGIARPLDQVILDDLIVDGSLCVGQDCVNGESFGFDTIRLKENNLRIKFQDTSNSASFPSRDWQITVNDSSNGGANKFSIDDIDGGRTPFTIEASAPSNSLYVDDGGRIGLGTSTPVVDLHVVTGNTPTLRLEQDGSSGFTAQTWDVAGNEANFFVRDVTNGSRLSFRIRPSAPESSIYIDTDGDIGLGTSSPAGRLDIDDGVFIVDNDGQVGIGIEDPLQPLHLVTPDGTNATFLAAMTSGSSAQISAKSNKTLIGSKSNHQMNLTINNQPAVIIDTNGYVRFGLNLAGVGAHPMVVDEANGAYLNTSGNWVNPSSRTLKENIRSLTSGDAVKTLLGLNPVIYNYKVDKEEDYVGFIAEDVPELVSIKDRKGMVPMDVVAVLTKVLQDQQKTIEELKKRITELEKKN